MEQFAFFPGEEVTPTRKLKLKYLDLFSRIQGGRSSIEHHSADIVRSSASLKQAAFDFSVISFNPARSKERRQQWIQTKN